MTWLRWARSLTFGAVLVLSGCITIVGPAPGTTPPAPTIVPTASPTPVEPTATAVVPSPTAATTTPTVEPTQLSTNDGHIIFRSDREGEGTFELFIVRPDWTELEKVADADLLNLQGIAQPDDPVLSPVLPVDGRRPEIAFAGLRDPTTDFGDIFVMGCCEISSVNLTDDPSHDAAPGWSPDGSRIAFESDRDGDYEIYIMDSDGSNLQQVTDSPGADANAVWHPDGQRLAFTSDRDGTFDVFVVNVDGSGLVQLTEGPARDSFPAWSVDGSKIAFASNRDAVERDVFVMAADGSQITRLTTAPEPDSDPWWSPDGTRIVFETREVHGPGGPLALSIMDADGANPMPFQTSTISSDQDPAWSPW